MGKEKNYNVHIISNGYSKFRWRYLGDIWMYKSGIQGKVQARESNMGVIGIQMAFKAMRIDVITIEVIGGEQKTSK